MPDDDEEDLRRRAYSIWEREGRPEGRHGDHWEQARRESTPTASAPSAPETGPDPLTPAPPPGAPRRIKPGQTPGPNAGSRATRSGRD